MSEILPKRFSDKLVKRLTEEVLRKIRDSQRNKQENDEDRDFFNEVIKNLSACSIDTEKFYDLTFLRCINVFSKYLMRMCPERWEFDLNLHSRKYRWIYEECGSETEIIDDVVRAGGKFNWPSDIFNFVKQMLWLASLDRLCEGYFYKRKSRSQVNSTKSRYIHINMHTHEVMSPEMFRAALEKPKYEENDPFLLTDVDRKSIRAGGSNVAENDAMNDMLDDFKRLNFCVYKGVKKPGPKCSRTSTMDLVRAAGDAFLDRPGMKGERERIERNLARSRARKLALERGESFPNSDDDVDISKDPRYIPDEHWLEIDKQRTRLKFAKIQAEDDLNECEVELKKFNDGTAQKKKCIQKLERAKYELKTATDAYEAFDKEQKEKKKIYT